MKTHQTKQISKILGKMIPKLFISVEILDKCLLSLNRIALKKI